MERHKGYEAIDSISAVVANAKEALANPQAEGKEIAHLKNAWRPDIPPRVAVHAVTVPLLEVERVRLECGIEEVGLCHHEGHKPNNRHELCNIQMERLCEESLRRFREHRDAAETAELEAENILDRFTEVGVVVTFQLASTHFTKQALEGFNVLDMQEIEDWSMSQVMQRSHNK
jgi:hypothetical protein